MITQPRSGVKEPDCCPCHSTCTEPVSTGWHACVGRKRGTEDNHLQLLDSQAIASVWQKSNLHMELSGRCLGNVIFSFLKLIAQEISKKAMTIDHSSYNKQKVYSESPMGNIKMLMYIYVM